MGKSFKRPYRVLAACFAICCVSAAALFAGTESPGISISEPNYSFGELGETVPVVRDFTVKNSGNTVLRISDVRPS
ncbi:MAG: hypothetical protein WAW37_13680 [Syntrophobacteraceae bacterium]